jgi:hypothetical protein
MTDRTWRESFVVAGHQLLDAVKRLLREGNVRRVIIKQGEHTIAEFPLTVGVIGAVAAPLLAAVGAIAAILNECTIEVERTSTGEAAEGRAGGDDRVDGAA